MINNLRTWVLMGALTALIVLFGNLLGGQSGMIFAFFLAAAMNFFSYWYSDRIVLYMYRAREVSESESPELYRMVEHLAQRAGLPMPRVYIIPEQSPNAFATGRNPKNAVVAVTEGLLHLMDSRELMGVLAHEIAHIKNRDILIGSIAATMAGAIMIIANMVQWLAFFGGGGSSDDEEGGGGVFGIIGLLIMAVLAPIAATLIQMAISRSREYQADLSGAAFAGNPEWLARALEKLGAYSAKIPMHAKPETAHMFIVNPLSGGNLINLFSTHPPLEERIARLRAMSSNATNINREANPREGAHDFWRQLQG